MKTLYNFLEKRLKTKRLSLEVAKQSNSYVRCIEIEAQIMELEALFISTNDVKPFS